jgi:hypothetical protein
VKRAIYYKIDVFLKEDVAREIPRQERISGSSRRRRIGRMTDSQTALHALTYCMRGRLRKSHCLCEKLLLMLVTSAPDHAN